MRQRAMLVSSFTLVIAAGALAQTFNQEPTISELQKQMEEMRAQMAKMQDRIAELEGSRRTAATSPHTDPVVLESQTPPAGT